MAKVSYPYLVSIVQQVILENRASFIAVLYCRALISSEKKTKTKNKTKQNKQKQNKKQNKNKTKQTKTNKKKTNKQTKNKTKQNRGIGTVLLRVYQNQIRPTILIVLKIYQ